MQTRPLFTVWSDGRLVGESALDYIANTSEVKFGDFIATRFGEQLIAIRMLPRQAVCAHAPWTKIEEYQARRDAIRLELRAPNGNSIRTDDIEITDLDWLMTLVRPHEKDDWESDIELADAELQQELDRDKRERDEEHDLIPRELLDQEWETIDVEAPDFSQEAASEGEGEAMDFPRYQIQVWISNGG